MVAIARVENGEDCVLPQRVAGPDDMPLAEVHALIRHAKHAPIDEVPTFRKIMRATRLPLPLRRLIWTIGLGFRPSACQLFRQFYGVTWVSAYGGGELHAMSPGPYILSFGVESPTIPSMWCPLGPSDYRRRPDRQGLNRLEQVLNTEIAPELRASRPLAEPKGEHKAEQKVVRAVGS